jgi:PilZ domain
MTQENRQTIRKRIGRLLYAELGADNGSILLDISEQGCSFQAIAPVREQQVHYTISVGDGRRVAGDAQVVWVDATARIGGLRFLGDSSELREQIRFWMEVPAAPQGTLRAGEQRDSEAKRRRKKLREEAIAQAGTMETRGSTKMPPSLNPPFGAAADVTPAREFPILSVQTDRLFQAPAKTRTKIGPAFVAISLAALIFTMIVYHQELGRIVMGFGASIAGEPVKPSEPPAAPASEPTNDLSKAALPARTGEQSGQSSVVENVTSPAKEQVTPVADVGPLRKPASATNVNLADDVPSLWTLVEGGDTSAELTLADRYIRGAGVTQSCAQARVLLEAALKRGSDEAKRKLDELPQAGCR